MHDDNRAAHIAAVAWVHEDDPARVISAAQKAQALKDGGASASSVRPYSLAAVLAGAEQQGRERVAWKGLSQEEQLRFVNEILDYGMGFVAPLHGVVVSIENTLRERNGTPAPASQPVGEAVAANECAQDVYQHGQSIGLFDIPKDTANAICAGITAITGARVDWHYIAGRVHMKAIAAPSVAQAGLSENAAMDIALRIIANLEDRAGVLDGVDDDTKADIADEIAVAILARSGQPAQEGK